MYNLRSRSKDNSKYPNNQRDVSMTSRFLRRSRIRSCEMNVAYQFEKQATNWIFTLNKIEELTSKKSVDSKINPFFNLSEKSNSSVSYQNIK